MPATMVEKILAAHSARDSVLPGEIVELEIDASLARDFGGANVVRNLRQAGLSVACPERAFFTFDCNPGGSDQGYAANQQICRVFAERHGVTVYDIDRGIGTHVALEEGLIGPGGTLVSTDSHANIVGAIGAFGQGMGDVDIAAAFATGRVWFKAPPTVKVVFKGKPGPQATAKDLALAAGRTLGAKGLLGLAAEFYGEAIEALDLSGRVTLASMCTEMGGIVALIPPGRAVLDFCRARARQPFEPVYADPGARYAREVTVDVGGLGPLAARPGRPEDVVSVEELPATRVDSVLIGSCTNGRLEDLRAAAEVLRGRRAASGVVLKIVPATDTVWRACLQEGLMAVFKDAGALVGNAGCAGCAAGQIGQNGPGEITVSTGNRNFPGKQGKGQVYLASPETAAASAVAGVLITKARLEAGQAPGRPARESAVPDAASPSFVSVPASSRPEVLTGRAWAVEADDIDTDMIYHNRHLSETDPARMGRHTFGNLAGWQDFPQKAQSGDLVVAGANFGCGSSRQQAVDCFKSLGISGLVARSFGAVYERNAVNNGLPAIVCDWQPGEIESGDELRVDLSSGAVENLTKGRKLGGRPMSEVELGIYRRGGLLKGRRAGATPPAP